MIPIVPMMQARMAQQNGMIAQVMNTCLYVSLWEVFAIWLQTTIPEAWGMASKPEDAMHTTRCSMAVFSPVEARYPPMLDRKMFNPPADEPVMAAITLMEIRAVARGPMFMLTRASVTIP